MSKRLTKTDEPRESKRFPERLSIVKIIKQINAPQSFSLETKRNACDRIKKIETLEKEQGAYSYEKLIRKVKNILKDDIQISTYAIFPGEEKNEIGKAILSDGKFFVAFSKIVFRCQYVLKKAYLQKLKDKYLSQVTENKKILTLFLEDEEEKIEKGSAKKKQEWLAKYAQKNKDFKKDKLIRKSCLKSPQKKSVRWRQNIIIDKDDEEKEKKQKIANIQQNQSFLIDLFEISKVYDLSMVDIVGIVDEINDEYVIMLIKQKTPTHPPSFVEARNSKMQENEYMKIQKGKRQILAIGLSKKNLAGGHKITHLKEIQYKYQDIEAYVDIQDPQSLFLCSLAEESSNGVESFKKQNKN